MSFIIELTFGPFKRLNLTPNLNSPNKSFPSPKLNHNLDNNIHIYDSKNTIFIAIASECSTKEK